MALKLSSLKVGDVISVDCGYCGIIDMADVTIICISQAIDLWGKALTRPHVVVRTGSGETFSLNPDIFA